MRRWGRIGAKGQMKTHHLEIEADAITLVLDLVKWKRARGYRSSLTMKTG